MKKHSSAWYRKKATEIAKKIVKELANYTCERCYKSKKKGSKIDGAHILSTGAYPEMSCVLLNILCLCSSCHSFGKNSWHHNPVDAVKWFNKKYPGRYNKLIKISQTRTNIDYKMEYEQLTEYYNKIQNNTGLNL